MAECISVKVSDIPSDVRSFLDRTLDVAICSITESSSELQKVYSRQIIGSEEIFSVYAFYRGIINGTNFNYFTGIDVCFCDATKEARVKVNMSVNNPK